MTNVNKITSRPNRRLLATENGCRQDLEVELPILFKAFHEAHNAFEAEIKQTPLGSRPRGFEASLLNAKMIQAIQKWFPDNWKFGKHKRFILQVNGYTILFKKFDKRGRPMNIKTKSVEAISTQLMLPLFGNAVGIFEPILFFGYQKDNFGQIKNPKLTYIDENRVQWDITEDSISTSRLVQMPGTIGKNKAMPKLKKGRNRQASGE
jgi:hypothetical protein